MPSLHVGRVQSSWVMAGRKDLRMTSVTGLKVPPGASTPTEAPSKRAGLATPQNVALGAIAATGLVGGGVIGALRGSPLKGLAVGGAVAAVALGAALLGSGSASQRDGYCDYFGDVDCAPPGTGDWYYPDPYYPDPYYPDSYGPGRGTSHGDDY